jgi:hypothetical protein
MSRWMIPFARMLKKDARNMKANKLNQLKYSKAGLNINTSVTPVS